MRKNKNILFRTKFNNPPNLPQWVCSVSLVFLLISSIIPFVTNLKSDFPESLRIVQVSSNIEQYLWNYYSVDTSKIFNLVGTVIVLPCDSVVGFTTARGLWKSEDLSCTYRVPMY
jgi:hypothetical protein